MMTRRAEFRVKPAYDQKFETKLIKSPGTEYIAPNSYCELYIKNICQSARYIIETQKESFPGFDFCKLLEYKMFGYT